MLRIGFALITTQLLAFTGLLLAGGFLLLWVCYKMWQELRGDRDEEGAAAHAAIAGTPMPPTVAVSVRRKTLRQAVMQIVIADVSMSLDNVLAVAGAAQRHFEALIFGLGLSVVLMGVAVGLHRAPAAPASAGSPGSDWRSSVYVAVRMVYEGARPGAGRHSCRHPVDQGPSTFGRRAH